MSWRHSDSRAARVIAQQLLRGLERVGAHDLEQLQATAAPVQVELASLAVGEPRVHEVVRVREPSVPRLDARDAGG